MTAITEDSKEMQKKNRKSDNAALISLLKQVNFPYFKYLFAVGLSTVLAMVLLGSLPQMAGDIAGGEIFDRNKVILYVALSIVGIVGLFPANLFLQYMKLDVERRSRDAMWSKFIHLPLGAFEKLQPSTLISRVLRDSTFASTFLTELFNFASVFLIMLVMFFVSLNNSVPLTLIIFPAVIALSILVVFGTRLVYKIQFEIQAKLSRLTAYLSERLSNVKFIKAEAMETFEDDTALKLFNEKFTADFNYSKFGAGLSAVMYTIDALVIGLSLIGGGVLLKSGAMTQAQLLSFLLIATNFPRLCYASLVVLMMLWSYRGGMKVISDINQIPVEQMKKNVPLSMPTGDITLNQVTFGYEENKVLKNISFTIPTGKTTAIVGASGSGKTTILKLLVRFYPLQAGTILFGETNAEEINLDEWRKAFGYVAQNSPLMLGTIEENITYGLDGDYTEAQMIQAAKTANIYDYIASLPQGFKTLVGELGETISTGQRQRIAIARAIIRDPSYLLLDEATSNLDSINEKEVSDALTKAMQGRTTVIVSHNLATVVNADQIIVLDKGAVEEQGSHAELVNSNRLYEKYFKIQFGKN